MGKFPIFFKNVDVDPYNVSPEQDGGSGVGSLDISHRGGSLGLPQDLLYPKPSDLVYVFGGEWGVGLTHRYYK